MALIEVKDLYKIYNPGENEVRALDGVSLTIDRGEFVAIIGHSGSGKSTFMNMLGLLDVPTSGEYKLDGHNTSKLSDDEMSEIRNKEIGFIFRASILYRASRAGKCGATACVPRYAEGAASRSVGGRAQACRA